MLKRLLSIIVITLFIAQSLMAQYPFSLPSTVTATIEVNTSSQEQFNNLLLGNNIFGFTTTTEKDLIDTFEPITVRFPHGLWANWYDWEQDKSRVYGEDSFDYIFRDGTLKNVELDYLSSIKTFDNANIKVGINGLTSLNSERKTATGKGFDMLWTFNMSADGTNFYNGSPVTMARYNDLINKGFEVKAIELGNECFYPGQRSSIIPNAAEYIKRAKSMSAALKAADSNIKVSVPLLRRGSWVNPTWNEDLTQDQSYYDAVTVHTYVGSNPDDATTSDDAYGTALTARDGLGSSIDDFAGQVAPTKPVWLSEWGVQSGGPNAVSALGMADCYLFMSENQNRYERANWFSVNGKLNSFLAWEDYDDNGKTKSRIKYPLEKTVYGSTYEIVRSVLENSTLLASNMDAPDLITGVDAVSARAVVKNGKVTLIVLNLTDRAVPFTAILNGTNYNGSFVHKAMSFSWLGQEQNKAIDENPLTTIKNGSGNISLPKLSISTIVLDDANVNPIVFSASVTAPANNTTIELGETIQLKADAFSNYGIQQVNFRANTVFIKQDNSAPYLIDWTPTAAGTYAIDVVAINNDGKRLTSETINVTVVEASNFVQFVKSNATGYAIDGGNGGANNQNVKIWASDIENVNQQWEEIDRGSGYYSYKKRNTSYCIDGGNGGVNGQSLVLYACDATNQNQQWKKVDLGSGKYQLKKRNASSFAIDGGNGGTSGQDVKLWTSNSSNGNQQWIVKTIAASQLKSASLNNAMETEADLSTVSVYPNPANETFNIQLRGFETARIAIYNISGQLIYQKSTTNNILHLSTAEGFTSGIYLIKVVGNNQQIYHQKLIVK